MDSLKLFNKNEFVYFSMKIEGVRNKETNKVNKVSRFPKGGYKNLQESVIFDDNHTIPPVANTTCLV